MHFSNNIITILLESYSFISTIVFYELLNPLNTFI